MPQLWKNQNFREMATRPILCVTMPSNFMQKIRKIKWTDFEKCAKNSIFGLSPGLFLDTPEHEYLSYSIIRVKTGRCTYSLYYLTLLEEKWAKSVKRFFRYWRKRLFLRAKCRHFGKTRIFRKWPLGLFYDPPCPLTSCKKSEKLKERILRNVQKTIFLDCHLVYFWTRQSMNASFIA